ncbi:MAG: hypothetical protein U9P90_00530 [Patescibacteria group bacterium]|nr:hypothetical protein [Patescibacteria group bacterium]
MWTTLGREQKVAFGLLIVLGISGLILGTLYFKNRLQISLVMNSGEKGGFENQEDSFFNLQNKDTDNDGLSDYDELYFYKTSPYLEDTDSDGYFDKEELDEGEDPNCVRGKSCGSELRTQDIESAEGAQDIMPSEPAEPADTLEQFQGLNVSELRNLLRNTGVSEEILGKISDIDLEKLYNETLKQTE